MRRIALSVAAGLVALLVVSVGLCQSVPRSAPAKAPPVVVPSSADPTAPRALPLGNALFPSAPPINGPFPVLPPPDGPAPTYSPPPPRVVPETKPPAVYYPPPAPLGTAAYPAHLGEKMIVKVYSVPDLVAPIQTQSAPASPFAAIPELALAMQQAQMQVQLAQQAAQPPTADVPDEVTKKLERLKKAIRVAAPKKTWTEEGGEGEIEVYPEALCLIVRQTASGHEAIGDLLTQLRATQNIQIELAIEYVSFDGATDKDSAEAMKLLNRGLSAEELEQFRKCGAKAGMSSVVRMANGRSASAGLCAELPLQFTAVATSDQTAVEFRTDLVVSALHPEAGEMAAMAQAMSQTRTVAVGKTLAFILGGEADAIMLVTPKVIDRSAGAAK